MRCKFLLALAFGVTLSTTALFAQVKAPPAPWRGAGSAPCVGSDGGVELCPPAPGIIAIRAGRMFNSKTGQMLTGQVVLLNGERITAVGPEAQVKIPSGAPVIDLSRATVLPGLIDAHTHILIQGTLTIPDFEHQLLEEYPAFRSLLERRLRERTVSVTTADRRLAARAPRRTRRG